MALLREKRPAQRHHRPAHLSPCPERGAVQGLRVLAPEHAGALGRRRGGRPPDAGLQGPVPHRRRSRRDAHLRRQPPGAAPARVWYSAAAIAWQRTHDRTERLPADCVEMAAARARASRPLAGAPRTQPGAPRAAAPPDPETIHDTARQDRPRHGLDQRHRPRDRQDLRRGRREPRHQRVRRRGQIEDERQSLERGHSGKGRTRRRT